ncbi:MAG: histidine--tRNA ligase [Patescibacteria group bacterium]
MSKKILSNQEVKGMNDWLPEEFFIRKYIFSKWREVCLSYGFVEYLTPILENAEIYKAKSGEDVGLKELMIFKDRGDRELAIRPEMTPSVSRMVSKIYSSSPKPIRFFSIANFVRNEKPQRGRNREFWQLNCDIFGDNSILSDLEILTLSLDIVLSFNPPKDSFVLKINNRKLINDVFSILGVKKDKEVELIRLMDKYRKLSKDDFKSLVLKCDIKEDSFNDLLKFLNSKDVSSLLSDFPELKNSEGLKELSDVFDRLEKIGFGEYIQFSPDVIRGFDYYDGLVFEIFDKHPDNSRAIFGGGRYNGLSEIFGSSSFPAVGIAPGDETFKLFLESWNLLPNKNIYNNYCYLPLLSESLSEKVFLLAKKLRKDGFKVEQGLSVTKIGKALEYANKKMIGSIIVFGEDELSQGIYKIKDMKSGDEKIIKLNLNSHE